MAGKGDACAAFFEILMEKQAPQIANRLVVEVCWQQKLFIAKPLGSRVVLRFGRQAIGATDLMSIIEEARVAAEALLYGLTTAVAIRLDEAARRDHLWALAQREQGSD